MGFNGSFAPAGQPRENTDYAIGFSSAALELIKATQESKELRNHLDFLVYPICFNMRQSVELRLKKWWKDLSILASARIVKLKEYRDSKVANDRSLRGKLEPFPTIDEASTHDLSKLWLLISEYAPIIDSRFSKIVPLLDSYIKDISDIDPTGQTFRYPASNDSQVHLENSPLINIKILELRFEVLAELLEFQNQITGEMKYEYSWVSIPNKLSYNDLQSIAITIAGDEDTEDQNAISLAKKRVMNDHNISSNEYSKAVHAIKINKILNHTLKIVNPPRFLTREIISLVFETYFKYKPLDKYLEDLQQTGIESVNFDASKITQDLRLRGNLRENIVANLSREQIAEIIAIIDFYDEPKYIEIFDRMLKEHLSGVKRMSEAELKDHVSNKFFGSRFLEKLAIVLLQLNCVDVIQPQMELFKLENVEWYKNFKERAYSRCFDGYHYFELSIRKLEDKVTNVLSLVGEERLDD